jgi:hypothetical protein
LSKEYVFVDGPPPYDDAVVNVDMDDDDAIGVVSTVMLFESAPDVLVIIGDDDCSSIGDRPLYTLARPYWSFIPESTHRQRTTTCILISPLSLLLPITPAVVGLRPDTFLGLPDLLSESSAPLFPPVVDVEVEIEGIAGWTNDDGLAGTFEGGAMDEPEAEGALEPVGRVVVGLFSMLT